MKRSEINKALKELEAMCREYRFALPPFCQFTPEQWQGLGHEYDEVRECMLGWDITDYRYLKVANEANSVALSEIKIYGMVSTAGNS